MSHLYTKNSTTKYFTKSPLVNELLIESILIKGHLTDLSALVSMDQLWIYIPFALFIVYPSLHDGTVSCYRSIEDYLFDGESTRTNNDVFIHESTTEANNAPEANNALEESPATSRRSSVDSSTATIYLNYTDTVAHNMTPAEFLTEEFKAAGPPKKRDEIPFEPTKSQRFWSDPSPGESDPFATSDRSSNSSGNPQDGHGFQFPTAPAGLNNEETSRAQGVSTGRPPTAADSNPPKSGLKAAPRLDSSSLLNSDFSDMSFVPPTGSISEKFPEFAKDNTPNPAFSKPPAFGGPSKATVAPTGLPVSSSASKGINSGTNAGSFKPSVTHKHSDASRPSKTVQTTGSSSTAPMPSQKKNSPPFDDHITPPQRPKFAQGPFSHADELARFAAKKQAVNDFADQMEAFLKRIQAGELPTSNTAGVEPPTSHKDASRHTQHLSEQSSKKAPVKDDTAPTKAQKGESSRKKKIPSQTADKPNLPQQQPSNIRVDAPPPAELASTFAKTGSSLTEAVANAPFMPRKKTQSKAASSTIKLSFSRFKTSPDDSHTDASNVAGPSSSLPQKQPTTYAPGPSAAFIPPFSSSSNDRKKKTVSPKPSLSTKPQLAYSPGSLRSPSGTNTQVKRDPGFESSFQHLRGLSRIHTVADASNRRDLGTPAGNSETPVDTFSLTTPGALGSSDAKTSAFPVSLMDNPTSSNTGQPSLETGLALTQSDENFFATTLGTTQPLNLDEGFFSPATDTAQPLNPGLSSTASRKSSQNIAESSSEHLAAAFFASDQQAPASNFHVSESNGDGFESVGLLAGVTTEPPIASVSDNSGKPKKILVTADVASTYASSRTLPLYSSISLSADVGSTTPLQRYGTSSDDTAPNTDSAPAFPVDKSRSAGEQEADADRKESDSQGSQPLDAKESHPPEGLVSVPCSITLYWHDLILLP